MPNTKRRGTKHRTHIFTGQEESWSLIRWLNSSPKKSAGWKRVAEILRIYAVAKGRIAATKSNDLMVTLPASFQQIQQIKKLLTRYRFRPELIPMGRGAHFQWAPVSGEDFSGEETAILGIMRLADGGLLDKVRECQCGRWFSQKSLIHDHCSAECRNRYIKDKDDPWREKRNEYRRKHYHDLKKRGLL